MGRINIIFNIYSSNKISDLASGVDLLYIDEIDIGDKANHIVTITQELHDQFTKISGDNSPVHCDSDFCSKRTIFKKPIGYAFLITVILSKIYGTQFPGGSELCLSQKCNFKKPYFIGDQLVFDLEVIQKNKEMKLITIKSVVKNQDGEIIFTGEALMQLSLGLEA